MGDEDELLLRYHFGDLTPDERDALEIRLGADPELVRRLDELRDCLDAAQESENAPPNEPEAGKPSTAQRLADKTVDAILADGEEPAEASGVDVASTTSGKRFSAVDLAAVAVAAGLLGMLVLPGLQASREAARRVACANNLHGVGQSLLAYAASHQGAFPQIRPGMNAGMFTVDLVGGGYHTPSDLERRVVCPSSDLAEAVASRQVVIAIPTRAELCEASLEARKRLQRLMAGSYAYRLGHLENGAYVYPPSFADCRAAMLADAPMRDMNGPVRHANGVVASRNHGTCGQNVWFQDGHVSFVTECWSPGVADHLYLNDAGEIAAGRGPRDAVLAPSEATPGVTRAIRLGF